MSANPLDRFIALPNRDAYATIRGFLYQAILSVEAWLQLSPTEHLLLEAGEDIDWRFMAEHGVTSRKDADRVLGQVKYRQAGLSLRSETSLASLVTFYQHRLLNPEIRLQFRLLSNARISQERGHSHSSGLKGIELWTSLKTITDPTEQKDRLAFLRELLLAPSEPPKIERKQLREFRTFVRTSSDQDLLQFVRSFSWMKTSSDVESSLALAEQAIRTRKELLGFEQSAPLCLQALLQHVLLTLSTPGAKELRPEACSQVLQRSQQQATEAVAHGLSVARERVAEGADLLLNNTKRLDDIVTQLSVHSAAAGIGISGGSSAPTVIPGQIIPLLDAPHLISPSAPRRNLRRQIENGIRLKGAAALVGDVACGKSQLVLGCAKAFAHLTWLSLRANEGIDPSALLDAAVTRSLQSVPHNGTVLSQVLVVDDLELGLSSRKFCDRLSLLVPELNKRSVILLACSTGRLPSYLASQIPVVHIGGYDDEDIKALLDLHNAPPDLNQDAFRSLISSITRAHPLLVGALLQFLIQRRWRVDDTVLQGLLSRSFSQDIQQEMQSRLLAQESPGAKELLYRVSLASRPITQDQALTLGELEPVIPNRNEELSAILDTWLQKSGSNLLLASPLVTNLGEKNLSIPVRQRVHEQLASWILRSRSLSQADAILCISHFIAADKAPAAGVIFVQALQALLPVATKVKDSSLLRPWRKIPLPKAMGQEVRIMIRGYQVAIAGLLGESIDYEFRDLSRLAKQASGDFGHLSVVGACSSIAVQLGRIHPMLSLDAVILATKHASEMSSKQQKKMQTDYGLAAILWLIGSGVSSQDEIRRWLVELGRMPEESRKQFETSEIAPQTAWIIFQQLWLGEQKKPQEQRDWPTLMRFLQECEGLASKAQISLLEASAFRAQQSIRIVHFAEPEQGDRLAWARSESFPKGGSEDFLIAEGTAIWLTDVNHWKLALPWFDRAAECHVSGLDELRMRNQLRRANAVERLGQNPEDSFAQALAIAEESDALGDLDVVLCLVEKAMWQWLAGDQLGCLVTWDRALELMLAQKRTTIRWKNMFVLMGNHTSVFSDVHAGANRADVTQPMIGLYLRDYEVSELYSDESAWFALATMVVFAERLGEAALAAKWALKTVEFSDTVGRDPKSRFVLRPVIVSLLKARDYDGAINCARDVAAATAARPQYNVSAKMREAKPELALSEDAWKAVDSEEVEGWAIVTSVLPALIDIVAVSVFEEPSGYALLASLTEKCREMANQLRSVSWQAAAQALTDLATGLLDWQREFSSSSSEDRNATIRQMLLAFGSGFVCRRTPKDIFVQQARWVPWLKQYFGVSKAQSADVTDKLSRFWLAVITRDPFYFRSPQATTEAFSKAAESSRIEPVFKAVAAGLSLSLPDWLKTQLHVN